MSILQKQTLSLLALFLGLAYFSHPASATPEQVRTAYKSLPRSAAIANSTAINVAPGRATAIDFSQTDEIVTYVYIADPSRVVYSTDAPLDSGRAKTLFLKPIQPLSFPGSTRAEVTNLVVKTQDASQRQRLYNFEIHHQKVPSYAGIKITLSLPGQQKLSVSETSHASLDDIETGLRIAIARGYTSADDPIVSKVQQTLKLAQTQSISLVEAAASTETPLSVLVALGRMGQENLPSS
jgi:hypothetical protein